MSLSLDFFDREKTGRLVSRMTSDIDALQELISTGLVMFVQNFLIFVGAVIVILVAELAARLGVLVIVPPVVIASPVVPARARTSPTSRCARAIGENLATLQEGLEGVRVVQAFGQERGWIRRFGRTNEHQYEANLETVRISAKYFPIVEFTGVLGIAVIVGLGGVLVDNAVVTVGTVLAFVLYLNNLFEPIQQLSQLYNTVQSAGAALHKLFSLLDTDASVHEKPGAVDLPAAGALAVDDVAFAYGGGPPDTDGVRAPARARGAARRVDRGRAGGAARARRADRRGQVDAGQADGPLLRPARGHGAVRRRRPARARRSRACASTSSSCPQEGFLFAGTIRDNVRVGRDGATDAEVDDAVAALGLTETFAAFPDGHGHRGARARLAAVGGGEAARVAGARRARRPDACSCSTRRRRTSTPGPSTRSSGRSSGSPTGAPWSWSRTGCPPRRAATASRSSTTGGLIEVGTHDELLARRGRYATLFAAWDSAHSRSA